MCGRFALTLPSEAVAQWFSAVPVGAGFEEPRYNICPTQNIQVAVNFEGQRRMVPMRWGFIPHWYKTPSDGPLLINARSETLAQKPAFRAAQKTRRCLIPASGFFEWKRDAGKGKEPWFFQGPEALLAFGAIWQSWQEPGGQRLITAAIVTTQAGPEMAQIHHREPVTLGQNQIGAWLDAETSDLSALTTCQSDGYFRRHRVSNAINSARSDGPELIEALEE